MKISTILDQIDLGSIALPEFQRGYVWNRDQDRSLMRSLYLGHPVGSLLVWVTPTESAHARGDQKLQSGSVKLLLDGQQRITSLYGLVRGKPPAFFQGNANAYTGLHFHLRNEVFSFFQPVKMRDDPLWIDVTQLLQKGAGDVFEGFIADPDCRDLISNISTSKFLARLNRIDRIKDIDLHVEEVTGEEKTVDVVVDIFNRVNSGGTKLSKGDLALAKVCAGWPEARAQLNSELARWRKAGYYFKLELLLRSITTTLTGEAMFSALGSVESQTFRSGLKRAAGHIDTALNLIGSRLGLDHDRVFGGRYALPLITRYLEQHGRIIADPSERDKLLYWYVHSFLWGRYSGSTETVLNQDLATVEETEGGLDRLIAMLRSNRGDLRLQPADFIGWSRSARFYPLLYMLTRVWHALDWETGVELKGQLLGNLSRLELHHIFPKALLYKAGRDRTQVNSLANFTFLTKQTNLRVSDKDPSAYLASYAEKDPKLISSHWIPEDPDLWKIERYEDFLDARRELLAEAANKFLETLLRGEVPEDKGELSVVGREEDVLLGGFGGEDEEGMLLNEVNQWVVHEGLPEGEFHLELADPETGKPYGILDLAWPDGLQEGLSTPVALLLNEPTATENAANRAGYRFFTDAEDFRTYVKKEILAVEE